MCAMLLMISGCGNRQGSAGNEQEQERGSLISSAGDLGRYMETFYEMPEDINRNGGVNWLEDGSLTVISFGEGLYRSEDGGQTWTKEEADWFPMIQDVYCLAAVMGPDGTVAASCVGEMPKAAKKVCGKDAEENWEGNYCVFVLPDGTVKIVDFGFRQEEGNRISSFIFKEDGRLFAGDIQGKIYEIDIEKEKLRELFVIEREAGYMDFSGETLMVVGYDRLYLYDLQKEVLLAQDETVDTYIRQMLSDGTVAYTSGGYPLAVLGSEEKDVIYIAGREGMYRHVLGGSVMEQVIDGALSTFGDSFACIYRVKVLENQEFLAVFQPSVGLVHYQFDATVPSMPDQEIRIYSLEENESVRQAVTVYKKEHTDIYVRYETGLSKDGNITTEDAVKRLNTQVLTGDGPDVLILDGLPVDTYIEKGMLRDIAPVLDDLEGADALFTNIVDGFRDEEGAVYTVPMCIRVPLLAGDQELVAEMEDLESIADQAERWRSGHPAGGIFGIYDPESMLRLFGQVSSQAWTDEDGQMQEAEVETFLNLVKRIYDAEMSGAVPEQVENLKKEAEEMASYGIDNMGEQMKVCNNVLEIPRRYAAAAGGYVESIQLCLDNVTSVLRAEEGLDYRIFNGQVEAPFLPEAMVGISSKTAYPEKAEEFVRLMFRRDTQENIYAGFPLNRAAYEAHFDIFEENDGNGSMMLSMDDGTERELCLYWPDQTERQKFTEYVETLKTPVLSETYLCSLVYETGVKVLEGERSAEEGAAEIIKRASVYLAE